MRDAAIAEKQQQYANLLRQQWDFIRRQGDALAGQEDPTIVDTVITRLVSSGMPENLTREQQLVWVSEQEAGLQNQIQQQSIDLDAANTAAIEDVLRRGRGRPPEWAEGPPGAFLPQVYQSLLEDDPDFLDPDSPLYGESQPMTGIRSIPHGSAGRGYGDIPLKDRRSRRPAPFSGRQASSG